MKALLIVDLQKDFCPGGSFAIPEGDKIVPVINNLIDNGGFDLIIATKDWHPADHVNFADLYPGKSPFDQIGIDGKTLTLWVTHCVAGTPGADFHPDLNSEKIDKVIYKGTERNVDSLSGFFDDRRLNETELRSFLESKCHKSGIPLSALELSVCGLALDYCVRLTALDAAELGIKTSLVLDASRAVNLNPGDDLSALRELVQAGVEVKTSRDIIPSREVPVTAREHAHNILR